MPTPGHITSEQAMLLEWETVQAAQANPSMFKPLYERYYEGIFKFVFKRIGEENDTADLTAQIFLRVLQKLNSYTFQGVPFSAWLYRIASNEVNQHFRNGQNKRVVVLEEERFKDMEQDMPDHEGLELTFDKLATVMQQLDLEEVNLIQMRFFEQKPFAEIAHILDITENNAKVKTYRLLARMKKMIDKL
jgi:RNA polymerase sigma-70 factor (ECF subfamily)